MKRIAIFGILVMLTVMGFDGTQALAATLVVDDDGVDCPKATYTTIQDAVNAAMPGSTIKVCSGTYAGATVNKGVEIRGAGNVVINNGPNTHSFLRAGFYFPPDYSGTGATIRGFTFIGTPQYIYVDDGKLDFPIFSRGADNVTIEHNVMVNSQQAITNWHGNGWKIQHNAIEGLWVLCGGGIGIIVASWNGGPASNNLIAYNTIEADVSPDCDFYTTSGITIYSDTRWGDPGGTIEGNRVLHNHSRVTGTWDGSPAADGFEITDGGLITDYPFTGDGFADVKGNIVAFNDFRGSSIQMLFFPEETEDNNAVSRNLGKNRGHGVTPASKLLR